VEQRVSELEAILERKEVTYQEAVSKITALQKNLKETEEILHDMTTEYCDVKAEIEKRKREAIFREVAQVNRNTSSNSEHQVSTEESSSGAEQSLTNVPTNAIERELHNNYKLLLLQISQRLLQDDMIKLKNWAASIYCVNTSAEAFGILAELDKNGVISSSNLTVLRDFFEGITRIDLVLIIENFLAGDYSLLRSTQAASRENHGARTHMTPRANEGWPLNGIHLQNQAASENSNPRISVEEVMVEAKRPCTHNIPHEQSLQVTTDASGDQVIVDATHCGTGKFT
jgi:FtsZ-binding cell division protein ZapB